jgi:hypothetical protein
MQQLVNIKSIIPTDFETQVYSPSDSALISSFEIEDIFDTQTDYIEYHIYNYNQQLIYTTEQGSYRTYNNVVNIDPKEDILAVGFDQGSYYVVYNFLTSLANSNPTSKYYISEISSDRTEIRLDSNAITNEDLQQGAQLVISKIESSTYYYDFFLNFGSNNLIIANNILLDNTDIANPTILIKLYEPLPAEYDIYSELWIVENLREPVAYSIEILATFDDEARGIQLKGPNFNLNISNEVSATSTPTNLQELLTTNLTLGTGSLQYNLNSLLAEKGIEINIDYSKYDNFIHFSSAQTRLENFYYKLSLIEQYQASASLVSSNNTYTLGSNTLLQNKIDDIITNFDGYEYYLYYTSASTAWPKTNTQPPYINASTVDEQALTWLTNQLTSASNYDETNKDNLTFAIPPYLRDDSLNSQFVLFTEMIGQHFDVLWTYIENITTKYNADNRLDFGISKDLVADALRDLGVSIYQNNFSSQNLYSALLGITPSGSLLNIPNTTLTLPAGTGLEYINSFVTASATSSLIPLDDVNKEIYKRIYHNLPYLLKKKGTTAGLRTLINLYGIPDTILRINEFGGKDRDNIDDWDNWQDQFNYSILSIDTTISSSANLSPDGTIPHSIQFRFKTPNLTSLDITGDNKYVIAIMGVDTSEYYSALVLRYTGSITPASYSGSILDPQYQYANLSWIPNINYPSTSASMYLPFFNNEWWSVMLNLSSGSATSFLYPITSSLFVKQKGTYLGDNYIKYEQSSSVIQSNIPGEWRKIIIIPTEATISGENYSRLVDSQYQELRYYNTQISQSVFDDFVMNPYSIEGNEISGPQSSYASLRFRAPLGSDLNILNDDSGSSVHPSATGSNVGVPTASFTNGTSNYYFTLNPPSFVTNVEYIYQDQPNAGIKIPISDKIKVGSQILPSGDTLSPYISIQQDLPISSSYTKDINYVEVGFSPQDEVNKDIQEQLGFFNIGDYIGDPRQISSSNTSYIDLNSLRDTYFQKYTRNYKTSDYIRLIKYFDNSLFKMIKDFVPARTGLATGVIIKQHILERNKYRTPQVDWEDNQYTGSVTSLSSGYATGSKIYTFDGGTGGSLPTLTTITGSGLDSTISQSWNETVVTPSGSNVIIHNNLEEFYTGEFEGSTIIATTQSLVDADCREFLDVNTTEVQYKPILYKYNGDAPVSQSAFLSSDTTPSNGEILLYFISEQIEQGSGDQRQNPISSIQ